MVARADMKCFYRWHNLDEQSVVLMWKQLVNRLIRNQLFIIGKYYSRIIKKINVS